MNPVTLRRVPGGPTATLYYGANVLDVLKSLPDGLVQTICTSPPYWNLRDYGTPPQIWGGDPNCNHSWDHHHFCVSCKAWQGQLGLEPTPDLFVENLVRIFREARRVLREDGSLWLNLGDSFMSHLAKNKENNGGFTGARMKADDATFNAYVMGKPKVAGLKDKDLVGVPWLAAFALRKDGWYLRSDIIWAKGNPMPESAKDRPTKAHEYIFLLTKKETYFFDAEAIKESANTTKGFRNKRSVWHVNVKPYKGAHFAVWPEALVEPMILAGSGVPVCRSCGSDWSQQDKPNCECLPDPCRSVVMDLFSGSGTTGKVALDHGRDYIGIDLNHEYLPLAEERILQQTPPTRDGAVTSITDFDDL